MHVIYFTFVRSGNIFKKFSNLLKHQNLKLFNKVISCDLFTFQSNNQYQIVQPHSTSTRKRHRKKRSSAKTQPTMGLASLRQHQANTLRRSEECLNTSSPPETSSSDSADDADNEPVWTRQPPGGITQPPILPAYGRGAVPPADTDTLPSSEDEDDEHEYTNQESSPQSEDPIGQNPPRIFVKNASGGFVGLTPNQLQQMQLNAAAVASSHSGQLSPKNTHHTRGKNCQQQRNKLPTRSMLT